MSPAQRLRQQRQAAVLRYVRVPVPLVGYRVVPVPAGQPLAPGQQAWFSIGQN